VLHGLTAATVRWDVARGARSPCTHGVALDELVDRSHSNLRHGLFLHVNRNARRGVHSDGHSRVSIQGKRSNLECQSLPVTRQCHSHYVTESGL